MAGNSSLDKLLKKLVNIEVEKEEEELKYVNAGVCPNHHDTKLITDYVNNFGQAGVYCPKCHYFTIREATSEELRRLEEDMKKTVVKAFLA